VNLPEVIRFEVSQLLAEATLAARLEVEEPSFFDFLSSRNILILGILLLLGLVALSRWLIQKRRKANLESSQDEQTLSSFPEKELLTIWKSLQQFRGKVITQEELDDILGIHLLKSRELRKVKRARLIKRINVLALQQFGKEFISRERNEEDRRMIEYRILDIAPDKFLSKPEV
jgi:hypothetical protein